MFKAFGTRVGAVAVACGVAITVARGQSATVRLYADVRDPSGAAVLNLTATDFNVREAGVNCHVARARLATEPMRIALLVDNRDAAVEFVKPIRAALDGFIDAIPAQDEVGHRRRSRIASRPTSGEWRRGTEWTTSAARRLAGCECRGRCGPRRPDG